MIKSESGTPSREERWTLEWSSDRDKQYNHEACSNLNSTGCIVCAPLNHTVLTVCQMFTLINVCKPPPNWFTPTLLHHRNVHGRMLTYLFFSLFSSLEAASHDAWIGHTGSACTDAHAYEKRSLSNVTVSSFFFKFSIYLSL